MLAVIVVVDLKGGSGKTTTAVFIAHVLQAWGRAVVLVDADEQQSASQWADICAAMTPPGFPFPVVEISMPTRMRQLWGIVDRDRFDTVVIDTPPLDKDRCGVVAEALRHATVVLVPLSPATLELHRVPATWHVIDTYAPNVRSAALLNRTIANAGSTLTAREALGEAGHDVMASEIPRREVYALAFPRPIRPGDVPYGRVAEELIGWGVV